MIFKWNMFGVFFISTLIFSTVGILLFPFMFSFVKEGFWVFNFDMLTDEIIIKTQIISVVSLLLVLYSYAFGILMFKSKVVAINHFQYQEKITHNLSKTNFYTLLILIAIFLIGYVILKRNVLVYGIINGLIGRDSVATIISRRAISSNYLYVIITYNLLPFLSMVAYFIYIRRRNWQNLLLFFIVFFVSLLLILLLFQKRPLILFLLTFMLTAYAFKGLVVKRKRKKIVIKGSAKMKYIIYGAASFSVLLLLFYSATNYKFDTVSQAVVKLSEVTFLRIFGRLAIPPFYYVHHFPDIKPFYPISNIGMLTKVLHMDLFSDRADLFVYYTKRHKEGSLAINVLFDFYGAFGYCGVVLGSLFLGVFLVQWMCF
jgi:oligosaccharide repeat unit polymerase